MSEVLADVFSTRWLFTSNDRFNKKLNALGGSLCDVIAYPHERTCGANRCHGNGGKILGRVHVHGGPCSAGVPSEQAHQHTVLAEAVSSPR